MFRNDLRRALGVAIFDVPRFAWVLMRSGKSYLLLRNRYESGQIAFDTSGEACNWRWTSDLRAAKVFPWLGRWRMRRALADHPIVQRDLPSEMTSLAPSNNISDWPSRSSVAAPAENASKHRGAVRNTRAVHCYQARRHLQLARHASKAGGAKHTPNDVNMPYCRFRTFNVGAMHANSTVLVLHGIDTQIPNDYSKLILARTDQGYQVVKPKRFVFYLSQTDREGIFAKQGDCVDRPPEVVVQNLEGGGSVAITREAHSAIGGMDKTFVGSGGEPNEFWERALTRKTWVWGGLPVIHLWHNAQAGKGDAFSPTAVRLANLLARSPDARIQTLNAKRTHINA